MEQLTRQELAVVQVLCMEGATDKEIGRILDIAQVTVKFHLANARAKAKVTTRTGLALWWIRTGQYFQEVPGAESVLS